MMVKNIPGRRADKQKNQLCDATNSSTQTKDTDHQWMNIFIRECKKFNAREKTYSNICLLFQKRCTWVYELLNLTESHKIPISELPLKIKYHDIIYELLAVAEIAINPSDIMIAILLKSPFSI